MKKLIYITAVLLLTACDCGCGRHKHKIGDVTEYKLNTTRVLILDTLYKNNQPYYKVKTDDNQIQEVPELELENRNY